MENKIDYVELPVTGGYVTKVDPDIAEKLKKRKLYTSKNKNSINKVAFSLKCKSISLSRFILGFPENKFVDHINGNVLDNRRKNLRVVTRSLNCRNIHSSIKNKTGFRGIAFANKYFEARLNYNNNRKYLGRYINPLIACFFRDSLVRSKFGKHSGLNFPEMIYLENIKQFLEDTNGKIFCCYFVKRSDGRIRRILCRKGVKKNIKNIGLNYDPSRKNLFLVFDLNKNNYRFLPLENILCVIFQKKNYIIERNRKLQAA